MNALDEILPRYVTAGYSVVARTDTSAQLVRGRSMSGRDVVAGGIIGGLFGATKEQVYLSVDAGGAVVGARPGRTVCGRCGKLQGAWRDKCQHCGAKYAEHAPLPA